jgi:3-phosphoshikimate 1-carboxyvinyltransferase
MSQKSFSIEIKNRIKPFNKTIKVDPDKSISIRSFLIGSISQNISSNKNVLESEDVFSTINCLKKLGVKIIKRSKGNYLVYGKGLGSFDAKATTELNFGNSGTLARLLIGILSTTPNIKVKIKGDHSLNKRSMKALIELMSEFGATFLPKNKYHFPLTLVSTDMPVGIQYKAGVSAQLKSAVIFAGLNSYGNTKIIEKNKSRDHTENILSGNHQAIKIKNGKERIITVFGKKYLNSININVPGDPSSAAFFTALTLLNKNSSLKIKNVGLNPTRTGFYDIIKQQGAKIRLLNIKKKNNEISGDIFVKSSILRSIKVSSKFYSRTTDEYLILFVIAALTKGISVFSGISDLSNKESSRAYEMKKILNQIGVKCILKKDEMKIFGKGMIDASDKKINVGNLGDHRVAMCAFIIAILTKAKTNIKNFETVYTSSPSFLRIMKSLGAKFEIKK